MAVSKTSETILARVAVKLEITESTALKIEAKKLVEVALSKTEAVFVVSDLKNEELDNPLNLDEFEENKAAGTAPSNFLGVKVSGLVEPTETSR